MDVKKVFVNTYKYDFHLARICIASIRYWYPGIEIMLIKDFNKGQFNTEDVERTWNVKVLDTGNKKFGWGYGKLEPLFLDNNDAFLVVDADTVFAGPVLDAVQKDYSNFIVDHEEQPLKRVNEIYYSTNYLKSIIEDFVYPGYTFNSGQWFGTSGLVKRSDFDKVINWTQPPSSKFPDKIFNGDQGHLNMVLQWLEQKQTITIGKIKLMIWPGYESSVNSIDLAAIRMKHGDFPFVIHWAGMGNKDISDLPGKELLYFYSDYYYSRAGKMKRITDTISKKAATIEKKINGRFQNMFRNI